MLFKKKCNNVMLEYYFVEFFRDGVNMYCCCYFGYYLILILLLVLFFFLVIIFFKKELIVYVFKVVDDFDIVFIEN